VWQGNIVGVYFDGEHYWKIVENKHNINQQIISNVVQMKIMGLKKKYYDCKSNNLIAKTTFWKSVESVKEY